MYIIDCFTRKSIAYHFGKHCFKSDVKRILKEAIKIEKIDLLNIDLRIRSDNGSQFTSYFVKEYLESTGIKQEHIHVKVPEENGHIESFHSIMQSEFIERFEFDTLKECSEKLNGWIEFYNNERIHSAIGYKTPKEFYEEYIKEKPTVFIDKPGRCL